jgi:hypothetical protein
MIHMRASAESERFSRTAIRVYGPILAIIAVVIGGVGARHLLDGVFGRDETHLYLGEIDFDLLDEYEGVLGIAHNAGDDEGAARLALEHQADIIEIDVVSSATTLYAGHTAPPQLVGTRGALTLSDAWDIATQRPIVMLDLKESTRSYLLRLAYFLHSRPSSGTIIVSRARVALEFFDAEMPDATVMLSVASQAGLDRLLSDQEFYTLVDGVSIEAELLTEDAIAALKARDLTILAWVVNTIPRVNELVDAGVDGIITDNLAILRLLGGEVPQDGPLVQEAASNVR